MVFAKKGVGSLARSAMETPAKNAQLDSNYQTTYVSPMFLAILPVTTVFLEHLHKMMETVLSVVLIVLPALLMSVHLALKAII